MLDNFSSPADVIGDLDTVPSLTQIYNALFARGKSQKAPFRAFYFSLQDYRLDVYLYHLRRKEEAISNKSKLCPPRPVAAAAVKMSSKVEEPAKDGRGEGEGEGAEQTQWKQDDHSPPLRPRAPNPASDPGVVPSLSPPEDEGVVPTDKDLDVFKLSPVAALKMLCTMVEALVKITGDVPPTPPASTMDTLNMASISREKFSVSQTYQNQSNSNPNSRPRTPESRSLSDSAFDKSSIGSPEAHTHEPFHIIGADAQPLNIQHGHIARKFYSKRPPPIPVEQYLLRLHRYCPMSTGVYLATAAYITRLALVERIIAVTSRNVHRLLLAALRVAMKALEDLSYPHRRFAKVGGVSEVELGRLEVCFCFLMNFELKVDVEMLVREATSLRDGTSTVSDIGRGFELELPVLGGRRGVGAEQKGMADGIGAAVKAAS